MQGASVFSPRARAPAGGRSRCGFAKQIRGFSVQTSDSKRMRCLSNFCWPCPAPTDPPTRGESDSMQGASVRKTSRQHRVGCAFLTVVQRKVCPRLSAQNGMHFPDGLLAESSSRNPRSERDTLSQRRSKRKVHPGIAPQNGTCFPPAASSTPKPMRPPFQNWVEESQNAIAGGQYDCRRQGKERRQGRARPGGR